MEKQRTAGVRAMWGTNGLLAIERRHLDVGSRNRGAWCPGLEGLGHHVKCSEKPDDTWTLFKWRSC